jgi:hypothetical protein
MATPTKYTYSISTDFPNGKVATDRLTLEIQQSAIVTALDYIETTGDDCDIWFKDPLSAGDQTVLDGVIAAHSGEPLSNNDPAVDSMKRTITVPEPETDKKMVNIVSHNFCDQCTWWQNSAEVTDETLSEDSGTIFSAANDHWIDLSHGRFYLESRVPNLSSYYPVVKVDGVTMTEREPFSDTGGDYVVDYDAGTVTFAASQTGKTVTASYHYGVNSLFTVAPDDGKILWVRDSEVQFSTDIVMTDTINFQAYAYNPADLPNKVPVTQVTDYKTLRNFVEEAKGVYPKVPAIGGSGPRGLSQEHVVFPFKYTQVKALYSSMGLEIRVWMDNHTEFEGEFGTPTFYCSSYDEE